MNLVIEKIKRALKKRKVKIFLVFLLCSALIWFINNLSRSYIGDAVFNLEFVNVPEGYLFEEASKNSVDVKLRAGGFQFLGFNFTNKKVNIDLSELESKSSIFFAPPNVYRQQIEAQLPNSMGLLEIDNDTLFFEMLAVKTKKVPVKPKVIMNLAKNYLLDGSMTISPDSITLTGPGQEIDTIDFIRTEKITLPDLASDFSENLDLIQSSELANTSYSVYSINLKGEIARFSEKIFKLPIKKINFPEGMEVRTFPEMVSVLCKAKMKRLKELKADDFQVVADYESVKKPDSKEVPLQLNKRPDSLHSAKLLDNEIEFILKRQ